MNANVLGRDGLWFDGSWVSDSRIAMNRNAYHVVKHEDCCAVQKENADLCNAAESSREG